MKKKGFCFKRAVSLLLAAVMIVTAAPQTSLTALAAEQGMTIENPDVSEGLDILTTEDGTSAETGDTAPAEDAAGQDGTDADGDIGDESADVPSDDGAGVGSDEQTGDPDNADQADNAGDNTDNPDGINQGDDAGNSDETADPEEGMDDDLTTDDESVSGNDLEGVMSVFGDGTEEIAEPGYAGDPIDETTDDGISYRRLIINENMANEKSVEIAEILTYYAKQIEVGKCAKFNCVELQMGDSFSMKKDYINGAIYVMDTKNTKGEEVGRWIDYNFWNDKDQASVTYSLSQPQEAAGDIDATCTVELIPHQGVKINVKNTEFPAESVGVSYNKDEKDAFAECWDKVNGEDLRLLALNGNVPTEVIEQDGIWCDEYSFKNEDEETAYGSNFGMSIDGIQAERDYLITPLYADKEPVAMGTTRELTAGTRSSSSDNLSDVKWRVFDEELISIEPAEDNTNTATLTAKKIGETYYYVTYQSGTDHYLELHAVRSVVDMGDGKALSYVGEIRVEWTEENVEYRRLVINEWEAKEKNNGAEIADILTYYAEQIEAEKCEKFNCVQFEMSDFSSPMKKADINGAISIMDTENKEIDNYWIDYNFWNDEDSAGVSYTLSRPYEATEETEEIDAACTVTLMPHQGVKINLTTTDFPAESVGVSYNKEEKDAFAECWDNAKEEDLRLLALDDGVSPGVIEQNGMWYGAYDNEAGSNFGMSIEGIQAGHDYLITPLYADKGSVAKGTTKELTAGERSGSSDGVSEAEWKSLNESLITIEAGEGAAATLTAKDETGEAYYYVTYKCDDRKWLELHLVQVADEASDGELPYVGEVRQDVFEDGENAGTPYWRLVINEGEARDQNNGAEIADILTYYAKQIEAGNYVKFNCVEFSMDDPSSPMKKDNINGAVSIMDTENEQIGYWIDYSLWNDEDNAGVMYTLSQPREAEDDLDVTFTVERVPHQGVKINAKTTEFPAEYVSVTYYKHKGNAFAACWDNARPEDLRLLALDDGVSPSVIESDGIWFGEYQFENEDGIVHASNFDINIEGMQAEHDYLITPLYVDRVSVAMGTTSELTAGERSGSSDGVSGAVWKSLDESLISIEPGEGADAILTAKEMGEAYYYVTYTREGKEWLELHSVQVTYGAPGGKLAYIGEIIRDTFEDGDLAGTPYLRLVIDEEAAAEQNKDKDITPILKFYKEKGEKFNCIELHIIDESPDTRVVKKDYINNALSVMDTENDTIGCWIDYNFWNEKIKTGVELSLGSPHKADADVGVAFTLTDLKDQGLMVKFASTAFPAERVSMSYNQPGVKYADSLPLNENPFRLFTHSSGTPKTMVDINEEQGWGYYSYATGEDAGTNVYFNNIKPLGTMEYLAASIYEDADRPVVGGPSVQLKAGKRAGLTSNPASVTWKLFDTDIATVDKDGKLTAWSNWDAIYYYAQYKVGSTQYLEVHEMQAKNQPVEIYFDKPGVETNITMEMNVDPDPNAEPFRKYLRLRFKPSDAERDTHDPNQIRWEITEGGGGDKPVIDFVYYDNDWNEVERDENGNLPAGAVPNGEIQALNEGTATVKVSYLDVDEGEPIPTATCKVKVVKPITWDDMEPEINAMNLYAVTDLDTKLSDVKLREGWKWVDPDTSLANFKGMDGSQFPAVYTAENGQTFNTSLWVRFVIVTGIEIESKNENKQEGSDEPDWFDWVPDSIEKGDKVTLRYSYRMDYLDGENDETWQKEYDAVKARMEEKYRIEWTSSPAAGTAASDGTYQFTAPLITKPQKYTFMVSVKDKTTNKVILKNSCAITVTVNALFDWEKIEEMWVAPDPDTKQMFLRFNIKGMTLEEYKKHPLTVVSEDPAILKLQNNKTFPYPEEVKDNEGNVLYTNVVVPCTNLKNGEDPKPGTAWIKMTAADEIKSSRRYCLEFIDKEPKLMESAVTINQALEDKSAEVTVRTHMQYPIDTSKVTLLLNGNATNDITANVTDPTLIGNAEDKKNSYFDYNIKLALNGNAASVKKGKNTVTLNLVMNPEDVNERQETYSLNLTVNVVNTVPKVTFKQAKKVNLFYKDEEGYGILNVNVTGTDIKELKLENCDFEVKQDAESGEYRIAPKANVNGNSKKGKLSYKLEGCSGTYTANFTVSAENKKPTIVLSQKSDTLYPIAGYSCSWLRMSDKATGEDIVPDKVTYVDKKANISHTLYPEKEDVDWVNHTGEYNIPNKADYNLLAATWGGIAFMLQEPKDSAGYKKKTDKFSLEIQKTNWKEPVAVSYSIKVDTAKPKLVLGKSTLTLNKNEAVYRAQQERTSLHLKGTSDAVYQDEWWWVRFEGQDEESRKILRTDNSLVLQYWGDQGDVIVNFNDNKMAAGTYKFKVNVGNNGIGLIASTVLTVKIVDIPITKTLKVTAKGSIDVMNKEGTSIAYTPKISNISGKVVEGRLEGMDCDMFENWWDGSKLIVKARDGMTFNTKYTYRVRAVFEVETEDYERLTISTDAAKPLSIKVKQSKPKLTASTAGNTIYRQLDNAVEIKLSALLNNREVEIDDVRLINYTDDFELKTTPVVSWTDEEGNVYWDDVIYNPETKSVRLGLIDRYETKNITKSGKTWKVNLAVRYREQAGNEKEAQVTCSIVVR